MEERISGRKRERVGETQRMGERVNEWKKNERARESTVATDNAAGIQLLFNKTIKMNSISK